MGFQVGFVRSMALAYGIWDLSSIMTVYFYIYDKEQRETDRLRADNMAERERALRNLLDTDFLDI